MVPAIPFVGRAKEKAELLNRIRMAAAGSGGLVLVGGRAGAGKTALVRTVLDSAEGNLAIALGWCPGPQESPAYEPYVDIVEQLHRQKGWDPSDLPSPFGSAPGAWSAYDMAGALAHWLGCRDAPVLLVVEDLHWANPAALDLTRHLAARLQEWPVLAIATYRSDEISRQHPLWHLLPELHRTGADRILLGPLTGEEVAELTGHFLGPDVDPEVSNLVWRRTGGHALFVRLLLEAASRSGQIPRPGDPLPETLQQAIDSRLHLLSPEAMEALGVAALCGDSFSLDLLAGVTRKPVEVLTETLEEAFEWHLILPLDQEGERFGFEHPLYREALKAGFIGAHRRQWHARIADALASMPDADPEAITYHLVRAGDPRAVAHLIASGDRARRTGALQQAADCYRKALAMAPLDDPRRGELLLKLGVSLVWGDPGQADQCFLEAEASGDAAVALWARHWRLRLSCDRNDIRCRERTEAQVAAEEQALSDPEYLRLEEDLFGRRAGYPRTASVLTGILMLSGAVDEARAILHGILTRAPMSPDYDLLNNAVGLALLSGRLDEAAALSGQAADAALAHRSYRDAVALRADQLMIRLMGDASPPEELDALAEEVRKLEEEAWECSGYAHLPRGFSLTGVHLYARGDWRGALHHVVEAARQAPNAFGGLLNWFAGKLLLRMDAPLAARPFVEALPPLRPEDPVPTNSFRCVLAHALRAALHLALDEPEVARRWLEAADRWPALPSAPLYRSSVRLEWAAFYLKEGQLESAWQAARQGLTDARAASSALLEIEARRMLGQVLAARGDLEGAVQSFQAAIDLAERVRFPLEVELTRLVRGSTLPGLAEGDRELQEAAALFDEMRAALGLKPAHGPAAAGAPAVGAWEAEAESPVGEHPDGLTDREIEVITLVAEGMTNREIARKLCISPKTVDRHLRNVFNKTGASNRAALATYAAKRGLVG